MSTLRLVLLLATVTYPAVASAQATLCTPREQWRWEGATRDPAYPSPIGSPIVVQLNDDSGDGRIDQDDVPDVAFLHFTRSVAALTALDGATGADLWRVNDPELELNALAAGDLDRDGIVEIVAAPVVGDGLVAFDHDGVEQWRSDPPPVPIGRWDAVGIADLDQDGSPEVYAGPTVFDSSGRLLWQGSAGQGRTFADARIVNAVDLVPASPGLELLAGHTAYAPDGAIVWDDPTLPDGLTAVGDLDGDGDPEVVLAGLDQAFVLDHLGQRQGLPYSFSGSPGSYLSQPLVADLDGDLRAEVVLIQDLQLRALRFTGSDLTPIWTQPVTDLSRQNGASAFDFDGDGAAEVIYHDENEWYVFDGRTGTVRSRLPLHTGTGYETPVVADIDNDCVTEVVLAGFGFLDSDLVIAYECDGSVPARSIWNQYTYHVSNVGDDGSIPVAESAPWTQGIGWLEQRSGSAAEPQAAAGPDRVVCERAAVALDGSSSSGCSGGALSYRWSAGATVLCDWSANPTCSVTPGTTTTYTLDVACAGRAACLAAATTTITVETCTLALRFDALSARRVTSREIEIEWSTTAEDRTLSFAIERSASAAGPFVTIAGVAAGASPPRYTARDAAAPAAAVWYRVVEYTDSGRGVTSGTFATGASAGRAAGGRGRRSGGGAR